MTQYIWYLKVIFHWELIKIVQSSTMRVTFGTSFVVWKLNQWTVHDLSCCRQYHVILDSDILSLYHIGAETKWPPFCKQHFQVNFRNLYFNSNFIEICPPGSHWQKASIGWDNGLVPNRWQAIISTNDCPVYRHIYVSFSLNEISCYDNIFDIEIASIWLCYNKGQVALVWRLQKVRQWCVYYEYSPRKYCA